MDLSSLGQDQKCQGKIRGSESMATKRAEHNQNNQSNRWSRTDNKGQRQAWHGQIRRRHGQWQSKRQAWQGQMEEQVKKGKGTNIRKRAKKGFHVMEGMTTDHNSHRQVTERTDPSCEYADNWDKSEWWADSWRAHAWADTTSDQPT